MILGDITLILVSQATGLCFSRYRCPWSFANSHRYQPASPHDDLKQFTSSTKDHWSPLQPRTMIAPSISTYRPLELPPYPPYAGHLSVLQQDSRMAALPLLTTSLTSTYPPLLRHLPVNHTRHPNPHPDAAPPLPFILNFLCLQHHSARWRHLPTRRTLNLNHQNALLH